jgi:uncharacterized membrane protein YhaH (DUF805 family)
MDWKTLFLNAEGRIGRKDFWIGVGILFICGIVFSYVPLMDSLWPLASIYFGVCVYGKRLHDIGQSAWLVLVPYGIMIVTFTLAFLVGGAALLSAISSNSDVVAAFGSAAGVGVAALIVIAGSLAALGWVIWLGTRDSEAGENRFGPLREVPLVTAI